MKRKHIIKTILCFAVILCSTFAMKGQAMADNDLDIPLQEFEEIDNVPYPSLTFIKLYSNRYRSYCDFTVDSLGQLKAYIKPGLGVTGSGSVWISRDHLGQDIIGSIREANLNDTEFSWFLESGTYYINYVWTYGTTDVGVALLFEDAATEESLKTSSLPNSNPIELEDTTKGFLSNLTPNDFYSFVVKEKANVTVEYSFDAANNESNATGMCTLYDSKKIHLLDGTYESTDRGQKTIVHLLEPGQYFVRLNGMYGETALTITPMYYDIQLVPEEIKGWTDEPYKVEIVTEIDYSEVLVVKKDVDERVISDKDIWSDKNELKVKVDGLTFEVDDSGVYSIRITDQFGNMAMEKIEIKNIDVTKPEIKGVKNNKAYKKAVTIKFTDEQSGIDSSKTTLNGKSVKSGTTVKAEGEYVLKIYDKMGNLKKRTFYIDHTAPTSGITNKKTYTSTVTLRFDDELSGIKKITVNNEAIDVNTRTRRYFLDGEYVIKMWDNAGNYKKEVFYIK